MQLRSLYPFLSFCSAHFGKLPGFSPPAQLQCLSSGVGEPGNEAKNTLVAVPGRNRTLFRRIFRSHCFVRSAPSVELPLRAGLIRAG